jgi:hypothetical protein
MKRLIPVFLILIFFIACTRRAPKQGIIERDKMVGILIDIHLVDGYLTTFVQADTLKQKASNLYTAVYKHHKIDSLTYKKSLEYYSRDPKLLDTIYHQVGEKLEQLRIVETETSEKLRSDQEKYEILKQETKGTLFKPYDVWFFRFTMPETFYPKKAKAPVTKPLSADSLQALQSQAKQKAFADSMARIMNKNTKYQKRMMIPNKEE